jgi:prohibitin 1
VVGVGAYILPQVIYDVDGGERAVMYDAYRGILPEPIGEGTHFKIPYLQKEHILSIRAEPKEIKSRTGTKDLQMVNIALRILSRPQEARLPEIYNNLGINFNDRVLPSVCNEVLKATVAKYNAEELLSMRSKISSEIKFELEKRCATFGLDLVDVAITHLVFGKEFSSAIEAKQVAQQEAERQQWVVEKAEKEREAAVIRAEGEAEAAMIVNNALTESGPGLIEVRRIDTAKEIAGSLASSRGVTYLPSSKGGNNMLLGLNAAQQ